MASTEDRIALAPPRFDDAPRILIVAAPFYRDIADMLIAGARAALDAAGAKHELAEVPGALEIPIAIRLAERRFSAFVALGCVIRGETTHYETVCNDSSRALTLLGVERGLCLGNGILTVETHAQAVVRADPACMNKGGGAAEAALHLLALKRRFAAPATGKGDIRLAGDPVIGGV
ncbi:6,7-dimethyl-8-ribityllumazine synthase [Pikeienuella piscinae]|uniref:6,7-dimethyl-8-ribityllumazine synthase n=1 Tax=Pikeienuella piscinae TaxID=2748098 RepID=A0A7L5BVM9_9RHOB|nr:6,7-dimethyl-8-ribityllumazine synthase [Pikeienuella piscinae]QIE54256.1 6,7-dimethyl-8-ribityllumazine synthase [Pikeienuella piscinae]